MSRGSFDEKRRALYRRATGERSYIFNTETGMLRACAYWILTKPKDIKALYKSSKGFRVSSSTRQETLGRLLMVSSLGFKVHSGLNNRIEKPNKNGQAYFEYNYKAALDAIKQRGGPSAIGSKKLSELKHRTYIQAISTLQMYSPIFTSQMEGIQEVPDAPGWLRTAIKHLINGVESVDTATAIEVAVSTCDKELEAEKQAYTVEIANRDRQIDVLTRTIADMTRNDKATAEEFEKLRRADAPPRLGEAPPLPPRLMQNIRLGTATVERSVSTQKAHEGVERRVQAKGNTAVQKYLVDIQTGISLKPPDQRKRTTSTSTKASSIQEVLMQRLARIRKDVELDPVSEDSGEWEDVPSQAEAQTYPHNLGFMLHPYNPILLEDSAGATLSLKATDWRSKMNDVFL